MGIRDTLRATGSFLKNPAGWKQQRELKRKQHAMRDDMIDAINQKDMEKVQQFIDDQADPDLADSNDVIPLEAIINQIPESPESADEFISIARLLLESGANPNATTGEYKSSLLHLASRANNKEMARLLLDHGAVLKMNDISYTWLNDELFTMYVDHIKEKELYHLLREYDNDGDTLLHNNVNQPERLKQLLSIPAIEVDAEIGDRKIRGSGAFHYGNPLTALHIALNNNIINLKSAEILLKHGADPDKLDAKGNVLLPSLIEGIHTSGEKNAIALLLKYGASPETPNKHNQTPLQSAIDHHSSLFRDEVIITSLLEAKADPNKTLSEHSDPPLIAAAHKIPEFAILMLDTYGGDIDITGRNGQKIIHAAISRENLGLYNKIILLGGNPEDEDKDGNRALHHAVKTNQNLDIVKDLVEVQKVNVNAANKEGETPLLLAAGSNSDMARYLLAHGADPNCQTHDHRTVLHYAAGNRMTDLLEEMVNEHGIPIDTQTKKEKQTALHIAAEYDFDETVAKLISLGAGISLLNANHKTPLAIADHRHARNTVGTLLEADALYDPNDISKNRIPLSRMSLEYAHDEKESIRRYDILEKRAYELIADAPEKNLGDPEYRAFSRIIGYADDIARHTDKEHLTRNKGGFISPVFESLMSNTAQVKISRQQRSWEQPLQDINDTIKGWKDVENIKDTVREFTSYVVLPSAISHLDDAKYLKNIPYQTVTKMVDDAQAATARFLMQDKSIESAIALSNIWHDRREGLIPGIRDITPYGDWHPLMPRKQAVIPDGKYKNWRVINLSSSAELDEEHKYDDNRMGTCINGFADRCMSAEQHIFLFRDPEDKSRSYIRTQLNKGNRDISIGNGSDYLNILYHTAPNNSLPTKEDKEVLEWFKKQVRTGDIKIQTQLVGENKDGAGIDREGNVSPPVINIIGSYPTQENRQRAFDMFSANGEDANSALRYRKKHYLVPRDERHKPIDDVIAAHPELLGPIHVILKKKHIPLPDTNSSQHIRQ